MNGEDGSEAVIVVPTDTTAAAEAEAKAVEAVAEEQTEQVETATDAAVEIARIEADRDVVIAAIEADAVTAIDERLARIEAWQEEHGAPDHPGLRAEIAELRSTMDSILARLNPPAPSSEEPEAEVESVVNLPPEEPGEASEPETPPRQNQRRRFAVL